eukprot:1150843-Pelagomonas_calceolata.AAC.2
MLSPEEEQTSITHKIVHRLHSASRRQSARPHVHARPCVHAAAEPESDVGSPNIQQAHSRRAQLLGFLGIGFTAAALPLAGPMPAVAQETPQMGDLANKIAIDFVKKYAQGHIVIAHLPQLHIIPSVMCSQHGN